MNYETKEKKEPKGMFIAGIVVLIPAFILCVLFVWTFIDSMMSESLGKAIGLVLAIIYFLIPGAILNIISLILNAISWKQSSEEKKKFRVIPFIISIITMILFLSIFIYILVI